MRRVSDMVLHNLCYGAAMVRMRILISDDETYFYDKRIYLKLVEIIHQHFVLCEINTKLRNTSNREGIHSIVKGVDN